MTVTPTSDHVRDFILAMNHPEPRLARPERQHLESKRLEAERAAAEAASQPLRSASHKIRKAVDRWSVESGWVALGLTGATATLPPQKPASVRSSPSVGDPTGTVTIATLERVTRAAEDFAHLAGPCERDLNEDGLRHVCPEASAADLADLFDLELDYTTMVDELIGTPPSSVASFARAVDHAASWHTQAASLVCGAWQDAHAAGAERDWLDKVADRIEDLSRRMLWLAGSLAEWSGRCEPTCKECEAAKPDERATCGRCRTARWRASREAS